MTLSIHQKKAVVDFVIKDAVQSDLFEDCVGLYEEGDEFDASLEGQVEEFLDACHRGVTELIERGQL